MQWELVPGLTCAFFLAQKGYPVTVFEKNEKSGGMLSYGIPTFRLEKDVVEAEIDALRQMGVEFQCGVEVGKDITLDELRRKDFKAFYLAIGCQGGRKAGISGEEAPNVHTGVEFLHMVNSKDDIHLQGRTMVIGGGNVAVDVARSAIRAGSSSVFMYCLEDRLMMPASKEEVDEALEEGIEIHNSWGPCEIQSEDGNVNRVILKKCVSVTDSEGHFQPQYDENERMTVECESVIVSIGQSIIWGDLLLGSKVQLARGDRAAAHSLTYQTEQPDVFVGGDVFTGPRFAIDAISLFRELPEASRMVKSEDKMKMVLPYALKRQIKIMRNKNRSV